MTQFHSAFFAYKGLSVKAIM